MPIWIIGSKEASCSLSEDQLRGLLMRYDTNRDGRLSKDELKSAFRAMGVRFSGWRAGRALRHADANGDHFITEDEMTEFVKYAHRKWGFRVV